MRPISLRMLLVCPLVILACGLTHARADLLVPTGPHVGYNSAPFGTATGTTRYQQVFSSSLFSTPITITSLAFSPDVTGLYQANVAIRLARTTAAVNGLSSNLDSNVTTPLTTVLTSPNFSQQVTGGTETFSLVFAFTTGFTYDPAVGGNLLIDIVISNKTYAGFGVSRTDGGGQSSRAFNTASMGNGADSLALRTLLGTSVVPEPSSLALAGIGLAGVFGVVVRRRLLPSQG